MLQRIRKFFKRNHNANYFVFIIIALAGYIFFYSSSFWWPSSNSEYFTPLNEQITWQNRIFIIRNWSYSADQNLMELELDIQNNNFDGKNIYEISAMTPGLEELEVKEVISEPTMIVLHICEIPDDWEAISVHISLQDPGEKDLLKLYTNNQLVQRVEQINVLDKNGYLRQRIQRDLETSEQELLDLQRKQTDQEEKIQECEILLDSLYQRKKISIGEELTNLNEQITQTEKSLKDLEDELLIIKEDILGKEDEIQQYQKKLQEDFKE